MNPSRAPSSKQFLIDRIVNQATVDRVQLTEVEIRMLGFSEATANARDLEAAQAFERDFDDHEYEAKIATLIRHAYERDKENGNLEPWSHALAQIAGRDLYLHVMLELAGVEKDAVSALFSDWHFSFYGLLPPTLCLVGAVVVGLSPFGARLIRNDVLRFSIAVLLLTTPFALKRISKIRSLIRRI
jgi:hypothetical protein